MSDIQRELFNVEPLPSPVPAWEIVRQVKQWPDELQQEFHGRVRLYAGCTDVVSAARKAFEELRQSKEG